MLYLLLRRKKGYRLIDTKLFTIEESKPLIKRDSEGLAAIDYESTHAIVQRIGFANVPQEELARQTRPVRWNGVLTKHRLPIHEVWRPLEEFKEANMKKEILREWKEFEDWYFSRTSSQNSTS